MCHCSAEEEVGLNQRFRRFRGMFSCILEGSEFHRVGAATAKARSALFFSFDLGTSRIIRLANGKDFKD